MKRRFSSLDIEIEHDPKGLDGKGSVAVIVHDFGFTLRLTLQDAETLGEQLVQMVRRSEEKSKR